MDQIILGLSLSRLKFKNCYMPKSEAKSLENLMRAYDDL